MNLQEIKDKIDGLVDLSKGAEVCNARFYSYIGTSEIDWLIEEVDRLYVLLKEKQCLRITETAIRCAEIAEESASYLHPMSQTAWNTANGISSGIRKEFKL